MTSYSFYRPLPVVWVLSAWRYFCFSVFHQSDQCQPKRTRDSSLMSGPLTDRWILFYLKPVCWNVWGPGLGVCHSFWWKINVFLCRRASMVPQVGFMFLLMSFFPRRFELKPELWSSCQRWCPALVQSGGDKCSTKLLPWSRRNVSSQLADFILFYFIVQHVCWFSSVASLQNYTTGC